MFILRSCPYCQEALSWMEELRREDSRFTDIEIKIVDEGLDPRMAGQYDYYFVPTYYVDGVKVHEGIASKQIVRRVFEEASR